MSHLFFRLDVLPGPLPLPFWTEYAPYLWGSGVDYDSDGDAYDVKRPWEWTILHLFHRGTNEELLIRPAPEPARPGTLRVRGDDSLTVRRASYLTALRSQGTVVEPETQREIPAAELADSLEEEDVRLAAADQARQD